jgi:PAS domain-containing protein
MGDLPTIEQLTVGQQRELAEAYLDLLAKMNDALQTCETGYGFFSWNGRGYAITGHPPHDLVERLVEAATNQREAQPDE